MVVTLMMMSGKDGDFFNSLPILCLLCRNTTGTRQGGDMQKRRACRECSMEKRGKMPC